MSAELVEARRATDSGRSGNGSSPARIVIQAWLASRGMIAAVALVLAVVQQRTLTDMVSNWDVQHFVQLAAGGYFADADGTLMAFFPGWPVILSSLQPARRTGRDQRRDHLHRLLGTCRRGALPAGRAVGGGRLAVCTDRGLHDGAVYRVAVLRGWPSGPGNGPEPIAGWPPRVLASLACTVRVSGLFLVGALLVMIITSDRASESQAAPRSG